MFLDKIDIKLLALIQENSNRTNKAFANELGLSNTATYERIRRLEREGVISKYVALVDKQKVNRGFVAFCHVKLVQHSKDHLMRFERQVLKLKEVTEGYHVSGEHDYILKIHVEDIRAYRDFMVSKLTAIDHIGSTYSSFVISEVKFTTTLDLG